MLWNQSRMYGAWRVSQIRMNSSTPDRQLKLDYRVKLPLNACSNIDATTSFKIPRGSLIEWFPCHNNSLGLTSVRWRQEDCLVSSAELNQNCERVLKSEGG
jgi:hypothetical protein